MKNIQLAQLDKYGGNPNYEHIEGNIYKDLEENHYVFALSYELEDEEDSQYPLEDILDEFYLHVSDFIDEDSYYESRNVTLELGGKLDNVRQAISAIIGKRVYNQEFDDEEGVTRVRLVIE
ncbi:hypothetical protein OGH69_04075 [Flavobacterium sp. MFBS3-15]|uniref:hypothetical protein n=1 Tax=Flavobacterium sp. MFBS3-15 TaxID=2989816 RepID=UPI002236B475|nr:hypothetical protein [Flavobacterium sp. MFBS3-15]MCW4468133.1 hypothetical protein [Flavobacterium sp. MFBS3-15]